MAQLSHCVGDYLESPESNIDSIISLIINNNYEKLEKSLNVHTTLVKSTNYYIDLPANKRKYLSYNNLSLLHVAAFYDSLECFSILHSIFHLPLDILNSNSEHPIQFACFSNSLEIATYILLNKPDEAKVVLPPERSLYMLCVQNKYCDPNLIKLLLAYNVDYPLHFSDNPLRHLVIRKDLKSIIAINEAIDKFHVDQEWTAIEIAISSHLLDFVPQLIEAGMNVNQISDDGRCSLSIACYSNTRLLKSDSNLSIINCLLGKYTTIEPSKQYRCDGPIQWICQSKSPQIAALFLSYKTSGLKFNLHRIGSNGYYGPSILRSCDDVDDAIDIFQLLLNEGFDINSFDLLHKVPSILELYVKDIHKNLRMIQFLLDNGADPLTPWVEQENNPDMKNIVSILDYVSQVEQADSLRKLFLNE